MPVNKKISFSIWYVFLAIFAVVLVHDFIVAMQKVEELPYSEFRTLVLSGKVAEVTVTHQRVSGKLKAEGGSKEQKLFTAVRVEDPDLVKELNAHNVTFSGVIESTFMRDLLSWIVPALVFVGIWFFAMRRFGQGQSGFMTVGQSKAKIYAEKDTKVTFADVAGVDEAKEELREVIDFLKTPEKFTRLGGKIPKGILLVGPPEPARPRWPVPWPEKPGSRFSASAGPSSWKCSWSWGGPRAGRFEQAKSKAPCIIFIDELDAPQSLRDGTRIARGTRADPESVAGRDGRLRSPHRRHSDGGHQSA
jgi:cell division protease FtsH